MAAVGAWIDPVSGVNLIVMASVSTVLFNGNPLLRFDGYYVLQDGLEVPNLGTRSNKYWQYLAERYLLDVPQTMPPPATPGEKRWFLFYAPAAFVYRLSVLFAISLLIAQQYFLVGVLLALWGVIASLGVPWFKVLREMLIAPRFEPRRGRIRTVLAGSLIGSYVLLFVVPIPHHTVAEGVIWLPEEAILRIGSAGFVVRAQARSGQALEPGEPVLQSDDPALNASLKLQTARLEEVRARYEAAWGVKPAQAAQLEENLRREQAGVDNLLDQVERLTARARTRGTLLMERPDDMPGRYLDKGEVVGYVMGPHVSLVRVVVSQDQVDLVRGATRGVKVALDQDLASVWSAQLVREVPAAGRELPSPALGQLGGGGIVTHPGDDKGVSAVQSLFEFELALPPEAPAHFLGSRVHVRFEHPFTPVGQRLWKSVRRLFLSQFHV